MSRKVHGTATYDGVMMASKPRVKKPSGTARLISPDKPNGSGSGAGQPPSEPPKPMLSVNLNNSTMVKIIVAPLLTACCLAVVFYFKGNHHFADKTAHLEPNERSKLETKASAEKRADKVVSKLKERLDLRTREIKLEQKELMEAATEKLTKKQQQQYIRIINEVRQTRAAIDR